MAFPSPEGSLQTDLKLVFNDQMVMFTCDKGEGSLGTVPGQLCRTPTQGDTESFSAAGQETQSFSLPPAWDHALRAGLGQFHSPWCGKIPPESPAYPKDCGKAGGMQTSATESLGRLGMAAWVWPACSLGITATAALACPASNAFLASA